MHLHARHPLDNLVEVAPGEFYTVGKVEENGWGMPAQTPARLPGIGEQLALAGTHDIESASSINPVRRGLKRPAPSSPVQYNPKRVATSHLSTGSVLQGGSTEVARFSTSLGSPTNGAVPISQKVNITEIEQCPNFWAMPVHELYEWQANVNILNCCILGYYTEALKVAEDDLKCVSSEPTTAETPKETSSGLTSVRPATRKRAPRAIRLAKEETPSVGGSDQPAFKFKKDSPNRLDLIFMRALEALSPFGSNGQKGKVFHECALWLKTDEGTRHAFGELCNSPNSRVLQVRYTQLKTWLAAAEGWSKMDSGTDEDDEELRGLIRSVQDEEETGRALKLAGKEEREAIKGRSLLAEAVREEFANKAIENLKDAVSNGDLEGSSSSSSSRKGKQSSITNTSTDELNAFRGELGKWNEVSLAAQAEQNERINALYERELRIMAQSLADHRNAKIELQHQRLEFDKFRATSSNPPLDNTTTQKFDALEAKMGSLNEALEVMMKHLAGLVPPTPIP
ncbi:hypothetical protein DFH28DRAFT_1160884 [Melampsora americana]|nr:hypothetical protein DFH28DRAFT_1160884 [Melampsora americana]